MKNIQNITFGVVVGVFTSVIVMSVIYLVSSQPKGTPVTLLPAPTQAPIIIQVTGEVNNPGVYSLAPGSRVQDIVNAAGGFTPRANQSKVNLASRLKDGEMIHIPEIGAVAESADQSDESTGEPSRGVSISGEQSLINLNLATLEELDSLPGIGATKAQEIIRYREEHGGFHSIDELKDVDGIGDVIFDQIKDLITIEPAS